jgi:uncharacterized membrane protein YeiH
MISATLLVRALDLIGTFVFAMSGASLGVRRGLDLFGVLVLGCVTAVAGGIMRDVLIGAIPPAALASWEPMALAIVASLLAFRFDRVLDRLRHPVQFFDAAGLGVFAVAGTQKALSYGLDWPMAVVLGMISGIGGGIARDVLTAQVPTLLRSEIYAVAALAGGLVVVGGATMQLESTVGALAGITVCVSLRMLALYRGWTLPVASPRERA